jgi:hypothetical protein
MKKIVKLTEAQLYDIVKKVLKEQSQQTPSAYTETQFKPKNYGSLFDLGKYEDTDGSIKQAIQADRESLINFMDSQNSADFTAKIIAGESQVTNPPQFKQKGSLALARAKTVYNILNDVYSDLIASGRMKIIMPTIKEVVIGSTPYKTGDQNDPTKLQKYKQEQYVSMKLIGTGQTLRCNVPLPVKGKKADAPNFDFLYNEKLRLNPKIKGINYKAFTIPDRPIVVQENGERTSPPFFVRERQGEPYYELKFPLELAIKYHLYPNSLAFNGIQTVDAYTNKVIPYFKADENSRGQLGRVIVEILKNLESDLTPELKQLYDNLVANGNKFTIQIFNSNAVILKKVFSKSPKIVTNSNGTPFNVNMQQTPSIKVGSYAPLDDTRFEITPYC